MKLRNFKQRRGLGVPKRRIQRSRARESVLDGRGQEGLEKRRLDSAKANRGPGGEIETWPSKKPLQSKIINGEGIVAERVDRNLGKEGKQWG